MVYMLLVAPPVGNMVNIADLICGDRMPGMAGMSSGSLLTPWTGPAIVLAVALLVGAACVALPRFRGVGVGQPMTIVASTTMASLTSAAVGPSGPVRPDSDVPRHDGGARRHVQLGRTCADRKRLASMRPPSLSTPRSSKTGSNGHADGDAAVGVSVSGRSSRPVHPRSTLAHPVSAATKEHGPTNQVKVVQTAGGPVIANGAGMTLYVFVDDLLTTAPSACIGDCRNDWPPP